MSKIIVNGHRKKVYSHEVAQVLIVTTRTFDFKNEENEITNIDRLALTKAIHDLLEAIGQDPIGYNDAFPASWDVRYSD